MGIEIFEPMIHSQENEQKLVTFFLVSYNQESFIREALESAFAQIYQPLEIVLSDDCSTDSTFEIMQQMASEYKGPHRIVLNQNEHNLGICGNVNRVLDLASGEIVVVAAGDDISLPDRVGKSFQIFEEHPDVTCVSFQLQTIDGSGMLRSKHTVKKQPLKKYSLSDFVTKDGLHINGASRAFRKGVYDFFGPLSDRSATEDSTTFLRCLMLGNACYSSDVEVFYRVHGGNYNASDNRHLINFKRIYCQYIKDVRFAVRMNKMTMSAAKDLRKVLRIILKNNMLDSGFYLSKSKCKYFFLKVLFSNTLGIKSKIFLFMQAMKLFKINLNG